MPPPEAFESLRRLPAPAWQQHRQQEEELRRRAASQSNAAAPGKKQVAAHAQKHSGTPGTKRENQTPLSTKDRAGGDKAPGPQKSRPQKHVNPARRRRRRRLAALAAVVLLIALGAWFSITVLFKINNYEVQGQGLPYSKDEIVNAFGHAVGDNLFGFSVQSAKERLETTLPYIEKADIRRVPPSTVQFRLTVAQEAYVIPWEGAFALLSGTGKVLRLAGEAPADAVRIDGLTGLVVEPGYPVRLDEAAALAAASLAASASASGEAADDSIVSAADSALTEESSAAPVSSDSGDASGSVPEDGSGTAGDSSAVAEADSSVPEAAAPEDPAPEVLAAESFEVLWLLVEELEKSGLTGITWLDVGDPLALAFGWQDRLTVKLGGRSGLAEKIGALTELLADPAVGGPQVKGTLDLSLYLTTGRAFLAEE